MFRLFSFLSIFSVLLPLASCRRTSGDHVGLAPSSAAPANSTRPGPMLWEVSHPKYVGLSAFLIGTQHDVPYSLLGFLLRSVVNHSDVFVGEILPGQPYVGQARRLWGPGPAAPAVQEELHHAAAADSENPETPLQRSAVAVDHSTGPADLNAEEINLLKGLHIIDPAAKEWYSELEEQLTEEEFERVRRAHSSFHFPGVEFGEVQPSALFSGLRLCVACSGFPADGMDHEIHNLAHQRGSWGDCYGIEDTLVRDTAADKLRTFALNSGRVDFMKRSMPVSDTVKLLRRSWEVAEQRRADSAKKTRVDPNDSTLPYLENSCQLYTDAIVLKWPSLIHRNKIWLERLPALLHEKFSENKSPLLFFGLGHMGGDKYGIISGLERHGFVLRRAVLDPNRAPAFSWDTVQQLDANLQKKPNYTDVATYRDLLWHFASEVLLSTTKPSSLSSSVASSTASPPWSSLFYEVRAGEQVDVGGLVREFWEKERVRDLWPATQCKNYRPDSDPRLLPSVRADILAAWGLFLDKKQESEKAEVDSELTELAIKKVDAEQSLRNAESNWRALERKAQKSVQQKRQETQLKQQADWFRANAKELASKLAELRDRKTDLDVSSRDELKGALTARLNDNLLAVYEAENVGSTAAKNSSVDWSRELRRVGAEPIRLDAEDAVTFLVKLVRDVSTMAKAGSLAHFPARTWMDVANIKQKFTKIFREGFSSPAAFGDMRRSFRRKLAERAYRAGLLARNVQGHVETAGNDPLFDLDFAVAQVEALLYHVKDSFC